MGSLLSENLETKVERSPAAINSSKIDRLNPLLLPALLVILTVASYAQVFSCGFIEAYDDEDFVTQNLVVLKGLTWHGLKWSLTTFMTGNWHPLTWWSHMTDVAFFGLNPVGHHITSLALHILNTLLLYFLLLRTTGLRGRCFLVAILFAIHPLHVESVAWIAERKDLLSTFFGLVALHCYSTYVHAGRKAFYLAMFIFYCLSLMSKPMLVTFPFLLLVLDYWPLSRFQDHSFSELVREKLFLLMPVLAISLLTFTAQSSVGAIVERDFLSRVYATFDAYLVYLRKLFVPYDLTAFYPYMPISLASACIAVLILAAISCCAWRYRRIYPWFVTGWLWFLGLLIPVIGIITVGTQAYADRYTYLPAVGVFILVVWTVAELIAKLKLPFWAGILSAAVIIAVCSALTWNQVGYWVDGFSLNNRDLEVVKGNWHAHMNLGTMLVERARYDEGIAHYQEALLNQPPAEANIYHNLGVAYERKGDTALAMDYFRLTVKLAPGRDRGYLGAARILGNKGDLDGALMKIREGLRNVPDNWMLLAKEAYLLHKMGNIDAAIKVYRQAISKEPDLVQNYVNLGVLFEEQGKHADFVVLLNQLKKIDSDAADDLAKLRK